MEEIIIQSKLDKEKRGKVLGFAIGAICVAGILYLITLGLYRNEDNWYTGTSTVTVYGYQVPYTYTRAFSEYWQFLTFWLADLFLIASIAFWIIYAAIIQSELTVSNVRVSGKTKFGKVVDLPIDKISAVGISAILSSVAVSTASGVNKFYLLQNYEEIYQAINALIASRQQNAPVQQGAVSDMAELVKYKELLDSGIITQDEYDIKKKQLLGF